MIVVAIYGMLQVVVASAVSAIRNNINRFDWNLGDSTMQYVVALIGGNWRLCRRLCVGFCYRELIALVVSVAQKKVSG